MFRKKMFLFFIDKTLFAKYNNKKQLFGTNILYRNIILVICKGMILWEKLLFLDYNTDGYRFNAQNYRNMHVNNLYGNTSSAHQLSYESVNHIEQNVHYYDNHTKKGGFLSKLKMKHLIIGILIMISSIIACLLIMTSAMNMKTHESGVLIM